MHYCPPSSKEEFIKQLQVYTVSQAETSLKLWNKDEYNIVADQQKFILAEQQNF